MSKTTIRLEDGYKAEIKTRSHTWYSDEPESSGGTDAGPNPPEMMLGALGACMAMTGRMYAERKGWPLEAVDVEIDMQRFSGSAYDGYDGDANFVHEIREGIRLHGPLDDEQKARIIEIMGKCPVRRVLANPVFFVDAMIAEEEAGETLAE